LLLGLPHQGLKMSKHGESSSSRPVGGPIDPEVMRAVVGNDAEMIRELAAEFLPGARAGVGEVVEAAAGGVAETVRAASHRLKGACALVGARHLIALCMELEGAAKAGNWPLIRELAGRLDGRLGDVEAAIKTFLAEIAEE
jgi:HPt (histidine-containing phosphotransfer) domain-containing protein